MKKTLKLMTMLLCVVSLASLSSCSRDGDIIGKWKVTSATSDDDFDAEAMVGDIWEFTADGVLYRITGTETYSGQYAVNDNYLVANGGILQGPITTLTNSRLVLELTILTSTVHMELTKI